MKKWTQNKQGFTIVELLIVITVIAVLASITIVAFNGISTRANETKIISDLKNINTAITLYYYQNGSYPATDTADTWANPATVDGIVATMNGNVPTTTYREASGGGLAYRVFNGGADYKLIAFNYPKLTASMRISNPSIVDPQRNPAPTTDDSLSYWSDGARNF